ncbi:uncharacterized protein LOC106994621 isoform X2 [Macaca mulatta]
MGFEVCVGVHYPEFTCWPSLCLESPSSSSLSTPVISAEVLSLPHFTDEETEASAACPRSCGCSGGQTSKIKVSTGLRSFLEETGNLHPSPVPCLCPMLVVSSEEGFSELQKAFWVL